jgi:hypothetical protein
MMIQANRVIGLLLGLLAASLPGTMRIVTAADVPPKANTAPEGQDVTWKSVGPGGGGWIQSILWDPTDAETLYEKWSEDSRYEAWMTRPEYRNFIGGPQEQRKARNDD